MNLITRSDEGYHQEYLFPSSQPLSNSKTKLEKSSHPITELLLNLIVNYEEHFLGALTDTGASSIIILETYTSATFIKIDDDNTTI
jgi:hypothetical protein